MDTTILARLQFAVTIAFHYIFPPITIGLIWFIVFFLWRYQKTGEVLYRDSASFWIKILSITFAVGVATGITMEFQFGTNWGRYSRFVGDIFGAPLAAEVIFAFFLESTFIGVLLYGEHLVSAKNYFLSSLLVAIGSTLSAFWIVAANSWQQTPAGFIIQNNRAELLDFWGALFNPSTLPRFIHTVLGAVLTGAFLLMGISAYYIIKERCLNFARSSLKTGLFTAFLVSITIGMSGHYHAVQVYKTQPVKLAAFEGLWDTQKGAPLLLFGIPDETDETTHFAVGIPYGLSILTTGTIDAEITGLKSADKKDRPPVLLSFLSFHAMVGLGTYFIFITSIGVFLYIKGQLFSSKRFLTVFILSTPLPLIANEIGWIAAEVGRQPWAVYNILRTKDAVSVNVSAEQILLSLTIFGVIYLLLFFSWVFLLLDRIKKGV